MQNKIAIQINHERTIYLVEEWTTTGGLVARVHYMIWNEGVKALAPSLFDYYTGYVRLPDGETLDKEAEENLQVRGGVTFTGDFPAELKIDGNWVGFDMNHAFDSAEGQSVELAKAECEKLAEQLRIYGYSK